MHVQESYHFYRKVLLHLYSGTSSEEKIVLEKGKLAPDRRQDTDQKYGNLLPHCIHSAMSKWELNQDDNIEVVGVLVTRTDNLVL